MWFDARFRDDEKFCENLDRIIRSRSPGVAARDLAILMGKLPPFVSQSLRKKCPPPTLTIWDLEVIGHLMHIDKRKLAELYLRESHRLIIEIRLDKEMDFAMEVLDLWRERVLADG